MSEKMSEVESYLASQSQINDLDELSVPYRKGDWLETSGDQTLRIVQVRKAYWYRDSSGKIGLYGDLWIYDYSGDKLGRVSPSMGGPTSFEPYCDLSDYQRIAEPRFPIELCQVPTSETTYTLAYKSNAKVLGFRPVRKKVKVVAKAAVAPAKNDNLFDPETEARALRLAAENLRDVARTMDVGSRATLIERAIALESQAERLLSPTAD
jgi:hypothetical protein